MNLSSGVNLSSLPPGHEFARVDSRGRVFLAESRSVADDFDVFTEFVCTESVCTARLERTPVFFTSTNEVETPQWERKGRAMHAMTTMMTTTRVSTTVPATSKGRRGRTPTRAVTPTRMGEETVRVAVPDGRGGSEDVLGALAGERIIFLGTRIDENVALDACARLLALEAEDPNGEIKVYINCVAGTQYCVTAILDTLQYVSCPVKTVALGCVAGPPVMLLAAGDKGNRYAMPSARIVLSQPLGGLAGTSIEVKIQAKELNRNAKAQVGFIARFTGKDADELEAMMARDTYMGVQEAIDFGLIDHAL